MHSVWISTPIVYPRAQVLNSLIDTAYSHFLYS